jgi:hypothetical protein
MLLAHALAQALDPHQHLDAVNSPLTVRNAVVGFLAAVFVLGDVVKFVLGRVAGRRRWPQPTPHCRLTTTAGPGG